MEHLMQIINKIWEILHWIQNVPKGKREELVDDYEHNFNTLVELIIHLERVVDGVTPYGRSIKWGYHLWQLSTYKRQHGLTLQAGWDDVIDFGIPVGKIIKVAVPRYCSHESVFGTPGGPGYRSNTVSEVCELDCIPRLQKLALRESVVEVTSQSSDETSSIRSEESETVHFDLDNLTTDELDSTSDSVPDLEDHLGRIVIGPWRTGRRRARANRLRLHVTPTQSWRDLFRPPHLEREGQPWREVLGMMVEEQQDMAFECEARM